MNFKQISSSKFFYVLMLICMLMIFLSQPSCTFQSRLKNINRELSYLLTPGSEISKIEKFPLIYYVVGDNDDFELSFTNDEVMLIQNAADEWRMKTNGIVDIRIIGGWNPNVGYESDIYLNYRVRTIWKISDKDPRIHKVLKAHGGFCGLSWGKHIILIGIPKSFLYF